jgi:hypothetical protein
LYQRKNQFIKKPKYVQYFEDSNHFKINMLKINIFIEKILNKRQNINENIILCKYVYHRGNARGSQCNFSVKKNNIYCLCHSKS